MSYRMLNSLAYVYCIPPFAQRKRKSQLLFFLYESAAQIFSNSD